MASSGDEGKQVTDGKAVNEAGPSVKMKLYLHKNIN